jgi:hypothetical protein
MARRLLSPQGSIPPYYAADSFGGLPQLTKIQLLPEREVINSVRGFGRAFFL